MFKTYTTTKPAGFALPTFWSLGTSAAVRTAPALGGVSVVAAAAERRIDDVAQVCLNTGNTDVFVLQGAHPGTPVWSPPI